MPSSNLRYLPLTAVLLTLQVSLVGLAGCGAAHVNTNTNEVKLPSYSAASIGKVSVYSNEKNAATNQALQDKLSRWQAETRAKIESAVTGSNLRLIEAAESNSESADKRLIFAIDSNVRYGNRAVRWAVGFGAGKGGVSSKLTVTDAVSGAVVYSAAAESDLAMGGAGGDMDSVFAANIDKLLAQYRQDTGAP